MLQWVALEVVGGVGGVDQDAEWTKQSTLSPAVMRQHECRRFQASETALWGRCHFAAASEGIGNLRLR